MKQSAFKNFILWKPRTKYPCRMCHCTYKVAGDTWIEVMKSAKSVDGKKAFRVFWLCHSGHRIFRGYTRKVSWKKNLGGDKVLEEKEKTYEQEDAEIENEYEEMVKYAQRMKGNTTGKLYH
jgi:hypothetical protein